MATLTKCDLCMEIVDRTDSYFVTLYRRADKTQTKNDICHKCVMTNILDRGLKPKWQTWLADSTGKTRGKYVDVS